MDDFTQDINEGLAEDARRLARYDEAIRLLRLCADEGSPFRLESEEIPAFLADEPKEGR